MRRRKASGSSFILHPSSFRSDRHAQRRSRRRPRRDRRPARTPGRKRLPLQRLPQRRPRRGTAGRRPRRGGLFRPASRRPRHRRHPPGKDHHARHHRLAAVLRPTPRQDAARPVSDDARRRPGTEESQGALRPARRGRPRQAQGRLRGGPCRRPQRLRRKDSTKDPRRRLFPQADGRPRAHRPGRGRRPRPARRPARCARRPPHRGVRQPAAPQGNYQGHRPPRLRRQRRADHGPFRRVAGRRPGPRPRRHQVERHHLRRRGRPSLRHPGRPARRE